MSDINTMMAGGDVEIESLVLVNFKKEQLDITALFLELRIFEDLYSPSLSANITLIDTLDVLNNFPIIGEEYLIVRYKTAGFPDKMMVEQTFYVTKMTDQVIANPHKRTYVLHLVTPESIIDINLKISKAFTGTPTKIIEKILKEELVTEKSYFLDESANNIKIVSPMWSAFRVINLAASKAMMPDTHKMSNFVFFETTLGYRFTSLSNLYDQVPIATYYYNNDPARDEGSDGSHRDISAEMAKIYDLRIDTKFDQMERLYNGAFAHTVWDHNLLFKNIQRRYYHYDNDFDKTKHLGESSVDSPGFTYDKGALTSSITTVPFIQNDIPLDNGGKIVASRIPLMNQLDMMKMDITVHGRTDLEVGDCVWVIMGGVEQLTNDDKRGSEDYYNGKYLITAIMHRITGKKHLMVMQVAKESVNAPYSSWGESK